MKIKKYRGVRYIIERSTGRYLCEYTGRVYWKGEELTLGPFFYKERTIAVTKTTIDALVNKKEK